MSGPYLEVNSYVFFRTDSLHGMGRGTIIHVCSNIQARKFENECLDALDDLI